MHEIDYSQWKEFRVDEIFEVEDGKRLTRADMYEGDIPFVGASAFNNGITRHVGNSDHLIQGHCITVAYNGSVGKSFYHAETFWAGDDVVPLRCKTEIGRDAYLFLTAAIEKVGTQYSFTNKWPKERMRVDFIPLPATPVGEPDWDYMENFMREVTEDVKKRVEIAQSTESPHTEIDVSEWKEFPIGELFNVHNGQKYPRARRAEGPTPLVSTSGFNNGVTDFVNIAVDPKLVTRTNIITVAYSGSVGATFYHPGEVFVGETVMALGLRDEFPPLNLTTGLFLSAVIRAELTRFTYTEKVKVSDVQQVLSIPLPSDTTGNPDWKYMSNFISNLKGVIND